MVFSFVLGGLYFPDYTTVSKVVQASTLQGWFIFQ
jgi:hypothetical protein